MRREKYATYLNEELGGYVKGIQAEYDLKSISLAIELIIADHKLASEMAKNSQSEKPSLPNQSVNLADQIAILHKQLLQGVQP